MKTVFLKTLLPAVVICSSISMADWVCETDANSGKELSSTYFANSNLGWAVGSQTIYRTTDGGQRWTIQTSASFMSLWSVLFIDSVLGWAVGHTTAVIARTTDGGLNWNTKSCAKELLGCYFTSAAKGWAVGYNGAMMQTCDSGSTWSMVVTGTTGRLIGVRFANSNTGWVVGDSGMILKTSDGGSTWNRQTSPVSTTLSSVFFTTPDSGWIVGGGGIYPNYYGIILRTVNGGTTWVDQTPSDIPSLISVFFFDSNTGWAVGSGSASHPPSAILKTVDGGANWYYQESNTPYSLRSVFFMNRDTGVIVGGGFNGMAQTGVSIILRTTDGGGALQGAQIATVPHVKGVVPVWSNSFGPQTSIRFNTQNPGRVALRIYDIHGRCIRTLVNDELSPGLHDVSFDASSLPYGVYFPQLEAGKYLNAGRMVIAK